MVALVAGLWQIVHLGIRAEQETVGAHSQHGPHSQALGSSEWGPAQVGPAPQSPGQGPGSCGPAPEEEGREQLILRTKDTQAEHSAWTPH